MNISVNINENDFKRFGLNSSKINWDDLVKIIKTELSMEALTKCKIISERMGLSKISLEEINKEIENVRNAKSNS